MGPMSALIRIRWIRSDICGMRTFGISSKPVSGLKLRLHVAIVATAKNTALVELYRFFSSAVNETIAATLGEDIPEPDMAAHRSLIDAIASHDPTRADETLRAFMSPILDTLGRLLNR
jgi:DNA-binding FadR family transcriptional regulator